MSEVLLPFVEFLESEKGKQLQGLLNEALGKVKKVEKAHKFRQYTPRVLKEVDVVVKKKTPT